MPEQDGAVTKYSFLHHSRQPLRTDAWYIFFIALYVLVIVAVVVEIVVVDEAEQENDELNCVTEKFQYQYLQMLLRLLWGDY